MTAIERISICENRDFLRLRLDRHCSILDAGLYLAKLRGKLEGLKRFRKSIELKKIIDYFKNKTDSALQEEDILDFNRFTMYKTEGEICDIIQKIIVKLDAGFYFINVLSFEPLTYRDRSGSVQKENETWTELLEEFSAKNYCSVMSWIYFSIISDSVMEGLNVVRNWIAIENRGESLGNFNNLVIEPIEIYAGELFHYIITTGRNEKDNVASMHMDVLLKAMPMLYMLRAKLSNGKAGDIKLKKHRKNPKLIGRPPLAKNAVDNFLKSLSELRWDGETMKGKGPTLEQWARCIHAQMYRGKPPAINERGIWDQLKGRWSFPQIDGRPGYFRPTEKAVNGG